MDTEDKPVPPQAASDVEDSDISCPTCLKIFRAVQGRDMEPRTEVSLGTIDELSASDCADHWLLMDFVIRELTYGPLLENGHRHVSIFSSGKSTPAEVVIYYDLYAKTWAGLEVLLVRQPDVPGHCGTGLIVHPEWIDLKLFRRWKDDCLSLHGAKCANPLQIAPIRPAWLIDTKEMCLVAGDSCDATVAGYVCLSYCWGDSTAVKARTKAKRENLHLLQQPKALNRLAVAGLVSPIVWSAIKVVRGLGERYLWVDSLCITQDDEAEMAVELNIMGAIYASAVVTIIAADGDSETALNGYFKRGWTYQELHMTSRKLFMGDDTIRWECQCASLFEVATIEATPNTMTTPLPANNGLPDIERVNTLLNSYNYRNLTHDEDAFPAIAGILALLSRQFAGGFLYGLPEMSFDMALAWFPGFLGGMRRRTASSSRQSVLAYPSGLPSWSWLGWAGGFEMGDEEGMGLLARTKPNIQHFGEESAPIAEWFTSSAPTGAPRRRIDSWWLAERTRRMEHDRSMPPPDGWEQCKSGFTPPMENGQAAEWPEKPRDYWEYGYRHKNQPQSLFWYPVPTTKTAVTESLPALPPQTQYVMCDTKRAWLWACRFPQPSTHTFGNKTASLLDSAGARVGCLFMHHHKHLQDLFSEAPDAGIVAIELVEVCRRRRPSASRSWDTVPYWGSRAKAPLFQDNCEVYICLWVKWKDGVAFRRAIAVVEKSRWESQKLEHVALVLG
ncbi:heterokaryon incompatibility protein-domain-containing protein [Podospora didyma]|uniref:Heterokaryon incompatibility protein-domain-containing protein n=1 Tax=Podospora didyma TaxID=330526 RepID=A0AAE0NI45_9PEZI|nr:heterokaryon incompatibility protein-domain-containing protein [Podospora didyma]